MAFAGSHTHFKRLKETSPPAQLPSPIPATIPHPATRSAPRTKSRLLGPISLTGLTVIVGGLR